MSEAARSVWMPRFPVLTILVPFALVFALCNYYRTVNAVLAPYLIEQLN